MKPTNKRFLLLVACAALVTGLICNDVHGQRSNGAGLLHRSKNHQVGKLDLGQPFVFINASPVMPYPLWDGMIDHRYGVHRPLTASKIPVNVEKSQVAKYYAPPAIPKSSPLPFPNIPTKAAAFSAQQRAEAEFRDGNYAEAASLARQVVILDPDNGLARLFAAQTLLATADYPAAVNEIKNAVSLLPPSEWDAIVRQFRLFYSKNDYVDQMERLNQYLLDFPTHREGHLLRGYQFASLGHTDAAINDLQYAIAIRADERLASDLLRWVRGEKFSLDNSQVDAPLPPMPMDDLRFPAVSPQSIVPPPSEGQEIEELPMPLPR